MKSECSTCKGCAFASVAACQTGKATHSRDKMYHAAVLGRCHPIQTMTQEHRDIPNHHICVYICHFTNAVCASDITFSVVSKDVAKNEWSYHICISYLLLAPLRHSFRCKSAQTLKQVEENPSSWLPWTVSFRPAQGWSVPTFLHIVRLPQEHVFIWKTWVSLGKSGIDNLKKTFLYGVLWPHGSRIRAISVFFAEGKWQERFPSSVFQLQSAPKKSDLTDVHPCLQTQCCYQL